MDQKSVLKILKKQTMLEYLGNRKNAEIIGTSKRNGKIPEKRCLM
jgi:hypothetical protein